MLPRSLRQIAISMLLGWAVSTIPQRAVSAADLSIADALTPGTAPPTPAAATPTPCAEADAYLARRTGPDRAIGAGAYLRAGCRPVPTSILRYLQTGKWPDGTTLESSQRVDLLSAAIEMRADGVDTIAVSTLEAGAWPEGTTLPIEEGARLVRALAPALTPYRMRLLLDIFEQTEGVESARIAVVQTLEHAPESWALLPAAHAVILQPQTALWTAAARSIGTRYGSVEEALTHIILDAPEGPILDWAVRLAQSRLDEGTQYPDLVDALYRRGH